MATRREFLKNSTLGAAAVAAPFVWTKRSALAQGAGGNLKLAAIGVGGSRGRYSQGGAIARAAARHAQMAAVCDVDDLHTEEFNNDFDGKLTKYRDYREMLEKEKPDVVTIGTPDHWHIPIALAALKSGCDVYCEKPLTLTIDEGIAIRKAVHESGKVFQVGTQQRSQDDLRFLKAIALVQSGRLGKNLRAHIAVGGGDNGGPFEEVAAPDDLDWNMWVGPAPKTEYSPERRRFFRWYYDYSGGKMTDWGAHHIDIAQWALGHGLGGPTKVSGEGQFTSIVPDDFDWKPYLDGETTLPNGYNTATRFQLALDYPDGSIMTVHDFYRNGDTRFPNGILFEGDDGRIFVNRGRLSGEPVENLSDEDNAEIEQRIVELCKGKAPSGGGGAHMANFFDCVQDRGTPISDVDSHHRTMTTCHLCNIALMLGRDLQWDPDAEKFVDDPEAEAFRSRKSRDGFAMA